MSSSRDTGAACEFAALFSLGALDAGESWRFRAHLLDGCDTCDEELEAFESVAGVLAYGAAAAEPSPILRDRLMDAIADEEQGVGLDAIQAPGEWEPYKVPGISVRRLHVDELKREAVLLVRAEAGVQYPRHRHAGVEEMFMLEGQLRFGETTYGPGDYIRSEFGSEHASSETLTGCMFLIRASLDNELLY